MNGTRLRQKLGAHEVREQGATGRDVRTCLQQGLPPAQILGLFRRFGQHHAQRPGIRMTLDACAQHIQVLCPRTAFKDVLKLPRIHGSPIAQCGVEHVLGKQLAELRNEEVLRGEHILVTWQVHVPAEGPFRAQ